MKKLFVLSLVAVLSVGLLSVGALAQTNIEKSDSAYVTWNYTCSASVDTHENVNEGDIAPNSSGNIVFADGSILNVEAESNCAYDLSVKGNTTNTPAGSSLRITPYFDVKVADAPSNSSNVVGAVNDSWAKLGGNGSQDLGSVDWSNVTPGSTDYWGMQYRFDADGRPAGSYQIELTYTLSTDT